MTSFPRPFASCSAPALLDSLVGLAGPGGALDLAAAGEFFHGDRRYELPRIRIVGPDAGHDPIRLGLFAGVHGDEPAGCTALVQFAAALAAAPERAAGYELSLYPLVNPVGCERGTRANHTGLDLNREFWRGSEQPEVRLLEAELRAQAFHGLITLHADDTCEGVYGYTHGRTLDEALLEPALRAAEATLRRDRRPVIDGFAARDGHICDCYPGVLSAPPEQKPQPFNVIFETPAEAPLDLQVAASVAALDAIIGAYRGFIGYAQNI